MNKKKNIIKFKKSKNQKKYPKSAMYFKMVNFNTSFSSLENKLVHPSHSNSIQCMNKKRNIITFKISQKKRPSKVQCNRLSKWEFAIL